MRIASSSPDMLTVASPRGETIFFPLIGMLFVICGIMSFFGADSPLRPPAVFLAFLGVAWLFRTKYRRWTIDSIRRTLLIEEYSLLGRARRSIAASDIQDVMVDLGYDWIGRDRNWFVLQKKDGTAIRLAPTAAQGTGTGKRVVTAMRDSLGIGSAEKVATVK